MEEKYLGRGRRKGRGAGGERLRGEGGKDEARKTKEGPQVSTPSVDEVVGDSGGSDWHVLAPSSGGVTGVWLWWRGGSYSVGCLLWCFAVFCCGGPRDAYGKLLD